MRSKPTNNKQKNKKKYITHTYIFIHTCIFLSITINLRNLFPHPSIEVCFLTSRRPNSIFLAMAKALRIIYWAFYISLPGPRTHIQSVKTISKIIHPLNHLQNCETENPNFDIFACSLVNSGDWVNWFARFPAVLILLVFAGAFCGGMKSDWEYGCGGGVNVDPEQFAGV